MRARALGGTKVFWKPGLTVALLLGGCLQSGPDPEAAQASPGPTATPAADWNESLPQLLVHKHLVSEAQGSVTCLTGEYPPLARAEGHVVEGTSSVRVKVEQLPESAYTGLRIGYAVDARSTEAIHWGPAGFAGTQEFSIDVGPDQLETADAPERWSFYYSIDPADASDCHVGAGYGNFTVTIESRN